MTEQEVGYFREMGDLIMQTLRDEGHIGREHSICREKLRLRIVFDNPTRTFIGERAFTRIYNSPYCAICTGNQGLWIPETWEEVEGYLRYYGSKVRPDLLRTRAGVMMAAYRRLRDRDVGPLFELGAEVGA